MKQILIIEDDSDLSRGLCLALNNPEVQCIPCCDLASARRKMQEETCDMVLLDINLPDGNGLEFLREIKAERNIPVVLLTANDTELDVVSGLEAGADDYITKPFSLAVLRARISTQLRRVEQLQEFVQAKSASVSFGEAADEAKRGICFGEYRFDFERMEFFCDKQRVELSKTEQKLLRLLVENAGITISRGELVDRIWTDGAEYVDENALSVTIKRLRDKLHAGAHIKTVYGIGYVWKYEQESKEK